MEYQPSKSPVLQLWKKFGGSALGRWSVSKVVAFKAPYFRSIKPCFAEVSPGRVEVLLKKRWSVTNHIGTVHAIAMCNAAELAGGVCLDVSLDRRFRWIPVGMEVKYLKMAKTNLRAVCEYPDFVSIEGGDVVMPVGAFDTNGEEVFHADITMRVSQRPAAQ
ncbi:hotdog fold domain-containing protein [uncultured Microbulbifer sp.]|uniref:hotdog fold domain-containing protein n=1 Tax=uncultured Microbulbifer sp. TaxID=348147 RepID=UPI002613F012|nr:hotdog fold domain-containing protein [uncultured Microbulbifer sp.]